MEAVELSAIAAILGAMSVVAERIVEIVKKFWRSLEREEADELGNVLGS